MQIVKTSNGTLALDAVKDRASMGGVVVDLGEVLRLERPEDGYTHLVSYSGVRADGANGVSGSALISEASAATIRQFLEHRSTGAAS